MHHDKKIESCPSRHPLNPYSEEEMIKAYNAMLNTDQLLQLGESIPPSPWFIEFNKRIEEEANRILENK